MKDRVLFCLVVAAALAGMSAREAAAQAPNEIDVASFEYLDVLETADGSVLRGVIVEQTPGVRYKLATSDGSIHVVAADKLVKLSKIRNARVRMRPASVSGAAPPLGVAASSEPSLPVPWARSGMRVDGELDVVFPGEELDGGALRTSFAPTVRIGYESLFGNFGLSGGFQGRFTYWMLADEAPDASVWTVEAHGYGQAALHLGRAAPYVGLTAGPDIVRVALAGEADSAIGLGLNLQLGALIAVSPGVGLGVGVDFHPGTDELPFDERGSISYVALKFAASGRL